MSEIPTIAIIGATGATGKFVLQRGLEKGFKIKVLARNPDKLNSYKDKIEIIKGSVDDLEAVSKLFEGVDVILSTLGTNKKPNYIVEKGVKVMLQAIEATDSNPKFVHMSAVGLGDSKNQCMKSWLWKFIVKVTFPLIGSEIFADMERAEDLILKKKNINSIIMRAAILNNKKVKGYVVKRSEESVGKMFISRRDIADFMLDAVTNNSFDGQAISLFSK